MGGGAYGGGGGGGRNLMGPGYANGSTSANMRSPGPPPPPQWPLPSAKQEKGIMGKLFKR
jgi:hypothetical protein